MRAAVVGHVEWVRFAAVERLPEQGEIITASRDLGGAGRRRGGRGRTASQPGRRGRLLRRSRKRRARAADARATRAARLPCSCGDPRPTPAAGLHLRRREPESGRSRCWARSSIPTARDPLPWDELAKIDAVYFTAGDADALRAARRARVLVATARELPTLLEAQVQLDALVLSARDAGETYEPGQLEPQPQPGRLDDGSGRRNLRRRRALRLLRGCANCPVRSWTPTAQATRSRRGSPSRLRAGTGPKHALAFAANCGAAAMTGSGAYEGAASSPLTGSDQ